MRESFAASVADWQSFYMLAGTASATLVGLLFVAVSVHIELIGRPDASSILVLARRTFTHFILVVIVALVFLVPHQDPEGLGLPLLAFGIVDAVRSFRVGRLMLTTSRRLSLVSGIGLILVAATLLGGTTAYLYWMVPIVGIMLATAAANAWDLMLGLARAQAADGSDASGDGPSGDDGTNERLALSNN